MSTCLAIFSIMCMQGMVARNITNILEEMTGITFHKAILSTFGLTPFLDSYPDLVAGFLVSIPAVILAIGIKVRQSFEDYSLDSPFVAAFVPL